MDKLAKLFFRQKKETRTQDAIGFLILFAGFFLTTYFILNNTGLLLHNLAAYSSAPLMHALGLDARVIQTVDYPHLVGTKDGLAFEAEINSLCAGAIELAVLLGVVLASRDKKLKDRLTGALGGFTAFAVFNPVRIALTLTAVGSWTLPFLHDVLFRISLFILIVGYYAVWSHLTPSTNR